VDDVPKASIFTKNNSLYGFAGIRAAYGFTRFIGVNLTTDLGYGETIQRELDNKWFTILGINADLNFTELIDTPVSLAFGYIYNSYPQNNNMQIFNSNLMNMQLSYIGRTNFVMSLDLSLSRELAGVDRHDIWLQTTMFSMRYLF